MNFFRRITRDVQTRYAKTDYDVICTFLLLLRIQSNVPLICFKVSKFQRIQALVTSITMEL